jgi:hypothetical protein
MFEKKTNLKENIGLLNSLAKVQKKQFRNHGQ